MEITGCSRGEAPVGWTRASVACSKQNNLAEREGFEPSDPVSQVNSLAVSPIRPLSHLSRVSDPTNGPQSCSGLLLQVAARHQPKAGATSRPHDCRCLDLDQGWNWITDRLQTPVSVPRRVRSTII